MGGKKKIDPATGKRIKYPSDFKKKKKLRTAEQKAARNIAQSKAATGKKRTCGQNQNAKAYF